MRRLLLGLALLAPLPALAQETEEEARDRGFLAGLIEDNLSSTARVVRIDGFEGALSSRATVDRLTIADAEGVWLDARDLVLDWNRSALFGGRLEVEELAAGSIVLLRAPVPDPAAARPAAEASPFSLPELPVAVRIGRLDAERIVLGEPLLGQELVLTLDGAVDLEGGEGTADIRATVLEGSEGSLVLQGAYSNATRVLDVTLDLSEAPDGLLATALDLPGRPAVELSLQGAAPIDDFAATIRLATDGEDRVTGTVATAALEDPDPADAYAPRRFDLDLQGDVTPLVDPELAAFFGEDLGVVVSAVRQADGGFDLPALAVDSRALDLSGEAEVAPEGWPTRLRLEGTLESPDGAPVALPGAVGTTVRRALLDLRYDVAQGDAVSLTLEIADLARRGTTADTLRLSGGGALVPARGDAPGRFDLALDYAATGLAFADAGLGEAVGAAVTGEIALSRGAEGGPVRIGRLTLSGPGVEASAEGTVAGPEAGFQVDSSVRLEAGDLGRFAALTGLDLGGGADLTVISSVRPLDGIVDLMLDGTTTGLRLGVDELDPLLAGAGTIRLAGARDESGTRIEELAIATPQARIGGEAALTSAGGRATLDLAVEDLGLVLPELPGPARATVTATRDSLGLIVLDADADLPGAAVTLDASQPGPIRDEATGEDVAQPVTLALEAEVAELAAFAPLLDALALPSAPRGAADVSVAGTLAPDAATFDLALTAETRDLALGDPRLDPLLAGEGRVAGRLVRTGPRDLAVQGLRVATDLVDARIDAALADGGIAADLDVAVEETASLLDGLSGPARVRGTAERTAQGATALDLAATLPGATARIDGVLAPPGEGSAFTGTARLQAADLAPFAPLAGRPLAGRLDASLDGTIRPDLSLLDLAVDAEATGLRLGLPQVDPLLAGTASLRGTVSRAEDRSGAVDLTAALDEGTLSLDGTLSPPEAGGGPLTQAFDGTVTADLADLAPLSGLAGRPLGGALAATLTGTVRGDLSTLDLTVDAAGTDLALGIAPADPLLRGATRLAGTVSRAADGSAAMDLDATLAAGTASVAGTVAPAAEGSAFTGDVAVDLPDLAPLSGLAGRPLGGALRATASGTARPDLSALDLAFEGTSRDLRAGLPQADPLLRGAGTFEGRVRRDAGGLALDLAADTPALDATVEGSFADDAGDARFDVRLADVAPLLPGLSGPASAAGTATRAADGTITVDADATAPGASAVLDATVAPPEQGYRVEGTADLRVADLAPYGRLAGQPLAGSLDGRVSGSLLPSLARFDLAVDAAATDLSTGDPTVASLLAGTGTVTGRVTRDEGGIAAQGLRVRFPNLSVDADATQSGGATATTFDARLADVGLFTPALSGPATARGTATIQGGATRVEADVTGPGGIAARLSGPLAPTPDLAIAGRAPLALLDPFVTPRTLAGDAAFDLRLAGGLAPEALTGTVTLSDARLSDPALGQALSGIGGTVALAGGIARVDLGGSLPDGGRLSARGTVGLAAPFVADLAVAGDGLVIRDPSLYEAQATARLTVAGPLAGGARIAGLVDVAGAEVRVPSSAIGALGDLPPVFHIDPAPAVQATLARADAAVEAGSGGAGGTGGGGFGLDVTVRAPARVFVRGRGLDAELGGQLRLTGTTDAIVPVGGVALLRGRLDILGQRFTLTEGTATLQGDFEPFLRFVAETTARTGTVVRVILEGPAASPEVRFESTPELPEDEVLAQLIFGVDLASITPFQAVQLASGVATLAGRGGGLIDDLRGGAGLSDLDITTDAQGNAALRLGQYLSENVYTDVTVSPQETEATINLDLTPDLTVRAGVSSEGETSVGIEFARDY